MISACEKGKHWEEALRLMQEMLHRSLAPDVVSHSAAISACEKGRRSCESGAATDAVGESLPAPFAMVVMPRGGLGEPTASIVAPR